MFIYKNDLLYLLKNGGVLMPKNVFEWIAVILLVIGGLNWGLVGLLNMNLVETIAGSSIARIVYILVGVSGVYTLINYQKKGK